MPSLYVDGEEEQTSEIQIAAKRQAMKLNRGHPLPEWLIALLEWVAREAFRAGFTHAHSKNTVPSPHAPSEFPTREFQLLPDENEP